MSYQDFISYLEHSSKIVTDYILSSDVIEYLKPEHIKQGTLAYLERPSKRLRPAVLLMSCGSMGGDESAALGAAAGVELFHTWTLVHDDVIDDDSLRRGQSTIHKMMAEIGREELKLDDLKASNYGRDIAILSGDVQHGWCIALFIDCTLKSQVDPMVLLTIIRHLQTYVLNMLVYGEVLDVQFGLQKRDILSISEEEIINMLWLKTGVLYQFSSMAGAMIGKGSTDINEPDIQAITRFTGHCGIAFQLQDDILGIVGDEKRLGKPVGSDIREGKKTTVLLTTLKNASPPEFRKITSIIGNKNASAEEIEDVKSLMIRLKGIEYTRNLARSYIQKALPHLDELPDNRFKTLLQEWANYMIDREF